MSVTAPLTWTYRTTQTETRAEKPRSRQCRIHENKSHIDAKQVLIRKYKGSIRVTRDITQSQISGYDVVQTWRCVTQRGFSLVDKWVFSAHTPGRNSCLFGQVWVTLPRCWSGTWWSGWCNQFFTVPWLSQDSVLSKHVTIKWSLRFLWPSPRTLGMFWTAPWSQTEGRKKNTAFRG